MTMPLDMDMQTMARMAVEHILRSLAEGTAFALLVGLLLRLAPRQSSATRFAVWFLALAAMLALPFLGGLSSGGAPDAGLPAVHAPVTVPASWAVYIFGAWACLAAIALLRVAAGLWQVRKLRKSCREIDPGSLDPGLAEIMAGARRFRPVSLCVSSELETPAALGFLKPAVVIPAWLLDEASATELKHVALHELTHLRRRDDWTNLAQRVAKALLFFHPCAWWIERRLSLEREMACDDAVLAQTANPRAYAQCLARVAEKSFIRRRLALAQAAVDRMRHLSLRVAQILDEKRPGATRLRKPVIPLVLALACLCAFSAGRTPELVSFREDAPAPALLAAHSSGGHTSDVPAPQDPILQSVAMRNSSARNPSHNPFEAQNRGPVHARESGLRSASGPPQRAPAKVRASGWTPQAGEPTAWNKDAALASLSLLTAQPERSPRAMDLASRAPEGTGYVVRQEQFVMLTVASQGRRVWQLRLWEMRVLLPSPSLEKRTSRKSI